MSNIQPKFEGPSLKNEKVQNFDFSGPRAPKRTPQTKKFQLRWYQRPIKQRSTLIWRSSIKNDKLENCAILRNSWLFWEKESCEAIFLVAQLLMIDHLEKEKVVWPL